MDRKSVDWRGYIPALTTPFRDDESLDEDGLQRLHAWVGTEGVHGVIVLGTQGEWFSLDAAERQRVIEIASATAAGQRPVIAGCNAYRAVEALRNIEMAAKAGASGALLTPPPYIMPTEAEILSFYEEVNAHSALPLCIYNWPPGTHIDMSLSLLDQLADLENVVALKNSTPDLRHFVSVLFALRDRIRVFGAPMNELGISLVREHGASGTMGAGAVLGSAQPGFFEAIWAGDTEKARALGDLDAAVMRDWFRPDYTGRFGSAQAIFKAALNLQGLPGGIPRRPILPLDEAGVAAVRDTLVRVGRLDG
jgi:4-hydroxy-tetrahydrodipicolinate synthase